MGNGIFYIYPPESGAPFPRHVMHAWNIPACLCAGA